MGRFREQSQTNEDAAIDMSPLIDCVFILLIFFIVTTTFVEETGVDVDKPVAASASDLEKNTIMIALTADNQVIYGGREIGIGGVQPLVRRMLQKESIPVIIQPDRNANAGMLVRIIDEAKLANAEKISISTKTGAN